MATKNSSRLGKPSGSSKSSKSKDSSSGQKSVLLEAAIRKAALDCGIDCDFFNQDVPDTKPSKVGAAPKVSAWGDGSNLTKLLDFLSKLAPLILPFILGEQAPKMGASAEFDPEEEPHPAMAMFGLSFTDVQGIATHVINLLESEGETALNVVRGLLTFAKAVTQRDMVTIFQVLQQEQVEITELIDAVKAEFNLS